MEADGETAQNLTPLAGGSSLALEVLLEAVSWSWRGSPGVSWCLLCPDPDRVMVAPSHAFLLSCILSPTQCHRSYPTQVSATAAIPGSFWGYQQPFQNVLGAAGCKQLAPLCLPELLLLLLSVFFPLLEGSCGFLPRP